MSAHTSPEPSKLGLLGRFLGSALAAALLAQLLAFMLSALGDTSQDPANLELAALFLPVVVTPFLFWGVGRLIGLPRAGVVTLLALPVYLMLFAAGWYMWFAMALGHPGEPSPFHQLFMGATGPIAINLVAVVLAHTPALLMVRLVPRGVPDRPADPDGPRSSTGA